MYLPSVMETSRRPHTGTERPRRGDGALMDAPAADPFRAIFLSARDAMLVADDAGNYVEVNPAACRLLDRTRDELLELSLFDVSPDGADPEATWRLFLERGEMSGDYVLARPDGTTVDVEFEATANVLPGLHLSVLRDVTERKRLERERAAMRRELHRARRLESLGLLATGVAHDFNTAMAEVRGHAELLRGELAPGPHPSFDAIDAAVDRAIGVTERLLAFAGKGDVEPRTLHVNDIVEEVRPLIGPLLGPKIDLVVDLTDDDAQVTVGAQMEQVLLNLIANARDAMPAGGRLTLATDVREVDVGDAFPETSPGRYAVLVVADDGIGMDGETLEHALDPFFTTKGSWSPSGLGLSSAYGFVTQLGGSVRIDSTPGAGTTVALLLPTVASS